MKGYVSEKHATGNYGCLVKAEALPSPCINISESGTFRLKAETSCMLVMTSSVGVCFGLPIAEYVGSFKTAKPGTVFTIIQD